jgi:hypothetical protein
MSKRSERRCSGSLLNRAHTSAREDDDGQFQAAIDLHLLLAIGCWRG